MWNPTGRQLATQLFGVVTPVEVLYEFEGPRIFTMKDEHGELNLAYWCDNDENAERYVVVPTTAEIVTALKEGRTTVREALDQPRCCICDVDHDGNATTIWRENFGSIPDDCLPSSGTMLLPSLEPLLSFRAIGDGIVPGVIPGSVIRTCVEGVQKTFKFLSEYVLGQQPQAGRPDEFMRRLFDLPAQRVAFASFEISFRMPIEEEDLFTAAGEKSPESETLEQVGNLLNKGLVWLQSAAGEEGIYSPDAPDEGTVLLRALKELTPSSQGAIQHIELRGRLLGPRSAPLVLERTHRQRVNTAIRNGALEPQLLDLIGRIRELDKDRLSFELREIEDEPVQSQRFVFDEELLEDVFQAFQEDQRVRVAGRTFPVRNVAYALALSQAPRDIDGTAE